MVDLTTHGAERTRRVLALLKSLDYARQRATDGTLPYRIDLLEELGWDLAWGDDGNDRIRGRVAAPLERATVPFVQAWRTRGVRRTAAATLAMFESEGHGLALWRMVSRRRRPPLVTVACWLTDLVVDSPRRARVYRVLYKGVDEVIVFSGNQVPVLRESLGISVDRLHVVRFGVDLDGLADVPVSEGSAVVAVGRDQGRDWAALVGAARGSGWSVDLVTRPEQVAGLDLPDEVRLHPPVDRAAYLDLLGGAGVVVVPTHVRQYPTGQSVLLEAMALGKACVVTDTPAMREYVQDGTTAVLVPRGDPEALRKAVDDLLRHPDRRAAIGAAAKQAEAQHGGARAMWAEISAVVERAVR